ncbi:RDD family protein [Alkalimonas delamerensis]|uniref:RDD family protein n=1 Tax=Alkalimonas delamerensis TaxID=265981 RepID=A0ABT9GN37_9GAMM|nr:RDD family protein [Alkalimonas delamerensis]MDP4528357.1 RDD family protein [Alkalimonas delamerensis]
MQIEPKLTEVDFDEAQHTHQSYASIQIKSPESERLSQPLASPGRRYLGQGIDVFITWALFLVLLAVFNKTGASGLQPDILAVVVAAGYFLFADSLPAGRSLGKLVLGMSVIDRTSGEYCTSRQSLVRNLLLLFLGGIDAFLVLFKKRQRLGDLVANTKVIRNNNCKLDE